MTGWIEAPDGGGGGPRRDRRDRREPRPRRGGRRLAVAGLVAAALVGGAAAIQPAAGPEPASAAGYEPGDQPAAPAIAAPVESAASGAGHLGWLEEVELLITDEERAAFLSLDQRHRREEFILRFWKVRDPFPETGRNEFLDLWRERLRLVRERFGDPAAPRGRAALLAGPPPRLEQNPCPAQLRSFELWVYPPREGRRPFTLVMMPLGRRDAWRLWTPTDGLVTLVSWSAVGGVGEFELRRELRATCPRGEELLAHLELALDEDDLAAEATWLPRPPREWVAVFLARSTEVPEGAERFAAELAVSFPGRHQSRTVVQQLLAVPVAALADDAADGGGRSSYRFEVDGEVLRDGELFDRFRYRFDLPTGEVASDRVPLVLQRFLRPGRYHLVLRAHDLDADRYYRVERALEVPRLERRRAAAPGAGTAALAAPASGEGTAAFAPQAAGALDESLLAEANAAIPPEEHRVRILPPPEGLLTGKVRVQATASGEGIAKVGFLLDGQAVMSKSRPPFSVELDLGHAPRLVRLEAVAFDADGRELARDRIPLNAGPHRFAVRLIEPRPGGSYRRSLRAAAEVDVPRGATLDRLELYLGDDLLATLFQPPFVQPILLPQELEGAVYVRAKALLDDGNATEDLVFINAPEHLDQLQVDFVELYATVIDRKGRPADDLTLADFEVLENGEPQRIRRFERVRDLPIWAGVLLDTSTSMAEEIEQAERAALKFFERVIRPRDRAAVIVFNDRPELRVPFTNSLEVLAGGLADIQAEGETALFDTLVYGLHYFAGIRGKRALILISDGEDSSSRHSYEETLDFARRTGTAVYTVGLSLASRDFEIRSRLMRLARETGGENFLIERASQLDSIYERIEEELRTQYLLGFQSTHSGDEFRELEVKVARAGLRAKSIPGYYP